MNNLESDIMFMKRCKVLPYAPCNLQPATDNLVNLYLNDYFTHRSIRPVLQSRTMSVAWKKDKKFDGVAL